MSASMEAGGIAGPAPATRHRRRRARLAAYGLWQLRDYLFERGAPTVVVALLFGYFTLSNLRDEISKKGFIALLGSEPPSRVPTPAELNAMFLHSFLGSLVFLGALFAMNGIVANDRKLGFYRLLFAKPVSPARYYGQAFVVNWVSYIGVMALLGMIYGALEGRVLSWPLMLVVALMYLCYAGIAFLLSSAARWDWLSLVAVSVVSLFLWQKFGESSHPLAKLLYLLPPLHRTDEVYAAVSGAQLLPVGAALVLPWHLIGWLAAYGASCFVLGLFVLRHRRLAIV
jgi:ABC-type transport system involved in multi-copper enzyme maturation permease subunit